MKQVTHTNSEQERERDVCPWVKKPPMTGYLLDTKIKKKLYVRNCVYIGVWLCSSLLLWWVFPFCSCFFCGLDIFFLLLFGEFGSFKLFGFGYHQSTI